MTDSGSSSERPSPNLAGEARAVPSGGVARGELWVPGSKSAAQRWLALALLAGRPTSLHRLPPGEDVDGFVGALVAAGWSAARQGTTLRLAPPAAASDRPVEIDCGAGGTMLRFLTAVLTAVPGRFLLDGVARLRERPLGPLLAALRALGGEVHCLGREGHAPLEIAGGSLRGGRARLDAGESSQYLSALLLAAQRATGSTTLEVVALTSRPYVDLTVDAIARCGGQVTHDGDEWRVEPRSLACPEIAVEADDSSAAYPAAAAALTGGDVHLRGLRRDSLQGDRGFLDLLATLGARVEWTGETLRVHGPGGGGLVAVDVDLAAMPDQVPTLAALAPFARGTTTIRGVPHLRLKESDRLAAMRHELGRLGVPVEERPDGLVVPGVWADAAPPTDEVTVDSHGDHRIAMALALVGLRRPGVRVAAPGVVAKSYPAFWAHLEALVGGGAAPSGLATDPRG